MKNIVLLLGILFYTIGCVTYTYDAIKTEPINKRVLFACICFDIGSLFFIIDYSLT